MQSSNHFDVNIWDSGWFFQIFKMTSYMNEVENKRAILTWERIIFAYQNVALKTTQRGSFLLKTIIFACHWKRQTNRSFLDDKESFLEKRSFSSDTKSLRSSFRISCMYCDSCGNRNTICADCCAASRRLQEAECLRVNSRKRVREKHCINQV